MDYNKKDIPQFQEEVCNTTCVLKGICIAENKDDHWFLMCPHYHQWKLGYTSFVSEQLMWENAHPVEVEIKHNELVAKAKEWGAEQRRLKKEAKKKEKEAKKEKY